MASYADIKKPSARERLLDAAIMIVRQKGFAATSIEDLCQTAGVTKGAFFHHFKSKDALGVSAADHWAIMTGAFFAAAPYHRHDDPLARVLGYLDFRRDILHGTLPEFTCLVGTMLQEVHQSSPAIAAACDAAINGHAEKLEADIAEAMTLHGIQSDWTAKSLALHTQAVLQGAFILAKAKGGPEIAAASIEHLKRYITLLFGRQQTGERNQQ
jgi:TetR/AcrR family transcriptional regulator, transcriptional repressor for nem operon